LFEYEDDFERYYFENFVFFGLKQKIKIQGNLYDYISFIPSFEKRIETMENLLNNFGLGFFMILSGKYFYRYLNNEKIKKTIEKEYKKMIAPDEQLDDLLYLIWNFIELNNNLIPKQTVEIIKNWNCYFPSKSHYITLPKNYTDLSTIESILIDMSKKYKNQNIQKTLNHLYLSSETSFSNNHFQLKKYGIK